MDKFIWIIHINKSKVEEIEIIHQWISIHYVVYFHLRCVNEGFIKFTINVSVQVSSCHHHFIYAKPLIVFVPATALIKWEIITLDRPDLPLQQVTSMYTSSYFLFIACSVEKQ